jgi:anti-anti-sigma factor
MLAPSARLYELKGRVEEPALERMRVRFPLAPLGRQLAARHAAARRVPGIVPFSIQPISSPLNRPSQKGPPVLAAPSLPEGTPRSALASLDVAIRRASENVIVAMQGQLTAATGLGISHVLADLIRDQGNRHLIIDVDDVTEVDCHGLEVLLQAKRLAVHCGATLTVRHPPEAIRKVLEAPGPTPA